MLFWKCPERFSLCFYINMYLFMYTWSEFTLYLYPHFLKLQKKLWRRKVIFFIWNKIEISDHFSDAVVINKVIIRMTWCKSKSNSIWYQFHQFITSKKSVIFSIICRCWTPCDAKLSSFLYSIRPYTPKL